MNSRLSTVQRTHDFAVSAWLEIPFLPDHQVHPRGLVRSLIANRPGQASYRDCRPLTIEVATETVQKRCRDGEALVYDDAIECVDNESGTSTFTPCRNARIFRYDQAGVRKWSEEWPKERAFVSFISQHVPLVGDPNTGWFKINWNGTVLVFHGPSVAAAIRDGFPLPDDRPKVPSSPLT